MKKPFVHGLSLVLAFHGIRSIASAPDYKVITGDSLSQIAKDKYGNILKWKQLYELNQDHIKNPNLIYPGDRLRLLDDEHMDLTASNDVTDPLPDSKSASDVPPPRSKKKAKSNEWQLLPKQSWETFTFKMPPDIDPQGFDRRSKVNLGVQDKVTPHTIIMSDRLSIQGEIINGRTEFETNALGDQVFIRADEDLNVGEIYSLTSSPTKVHSKRDGRVGFEYSIYGNVKIVGVRDNVFIGTIVFASAPIMRNYLLIPEVKHLVLGEPIPSSAPIEGAVIMNPQGDFSRFAQENLVFIDVGSDDGVKPNMVFREFLHEDPNNHELISSKDFLIEAEMQVLDVQEKFSTAIILNTKNYVADGSEIISLTDLAGLKINYGLQSTIQDKTDSKSLDELDKLDNNEGLGDKENSELRQLEHYKKAVPGGGNDDIEKENLHPQNPSAGPGEETAPNDGSNKREKPVGGEGVPDKDALPPSPEGAPPETFKTGTVPPANGEPTPAPTQDHSDKPDPNIVAPPPDAPKSDAPKTDAPKTGGPPASAPSTDAPGTPPTTGGNAPSVNDPLPPSP